MVTSQSVAPELSALGAQMLTIKVMVFIPTTALLKRMHPDERTGKRFSSVSKPLKEMIPIREFIHIIEELSNQYQAIITLSVPPHRYRLVNNYFGKRKYTCAGKDQRTLLVEIEDCCVRPPIKVEKVKKINNAIAVMNSDITVILGPVCRVGADLIKTAKSAIKPVIILDSKNGAKIPTVP